jgi:hypothetical protein
MNSEILRKLEKLDISKEMKDEIKAFMEKQQVKKEVKEEEKKEEVKKEEVKEVKKEEVKEEVKKEEVKKEEVKEEIKAEEDEISEVEKIVPKKLIINESEEIVVHCLNLICEEKHLSFWDLFEYISKYSTTDISLCKKIITDTYKGIINLLKIFNIKKINDKTLVVRWRPERHIDVYFEWENIDKINNKFKFIQVSDEEYLYFYIENNFLQKFIRKIYINNKKHCNLEEFLQVIEEAKKEVMKIA